MSRNSQFIFAFFFATFFAGASLAQNQPNQTQGQQGWYRQQISAIGNSVSIFFIDQNTGWVVFDSLYYTTDGGSTWKGISKVPTGNPIPIHNLYFTDKNNGWAENDTTLVRTSDGGKNWQIVKAPFRGDMKVFGMDTIYLFNGGRFGRTTDAGKNWIDMQVTQQGTSLINMSFSESKFGFIGGQKIVWNGNPPPQKGTFGASFWVTRDGGITWTQKYCPVQEGMDEIYDLDSNTFFASTENAHLVRSSNGGTKWDTVGQEIAGFDFFFLNKQIGYIADGRGVVLFSNDSGKTWITQNTGATTSLNSIFFVDSLNGWAAGDNGVVLHTTNGGKSLVRQYLPLPLSVRAIPEPFSIKTTLSYSIPKAANVDVKLYDVLGKEVYHVTSDGIQSEGAHSIEISGEHLPGGVYYFILTAGSFNGMGKVTKIAP